MKIMNKLLSLFLAAVMLLSAVPTYAFAAETANDTSSHTHSEEAAPLAVADTDVAKIGDTGYATLADAVTAAAAGDTIELLKDFALTATVTISKNLTVKAAEGTSVTISRGESFKNAFFKVTKASLTLSGSLTLDGAMADGSSKAYGGLVWCASGTSSAPSNFTMNDGVTLKNNEHTKSFTSASSMEGGAVSVVGAGTFTMNGGTITKCGVNNKSNTGKYNSGGGGAVLLFSTSTANYPTMVMEGGTISECYGNEGGAIRIVNNYATTGSVTFTMNGGTIKDCIANTGLSTSSIKGNGGAIYMFNKTSNATDKIIVTINGGSITDNTAYRYGGAIGMASTTGTTCNGGEIRILGGTISGNVAGNNGKTDGTPGDAYGQGIFIQGVAKDGGAMLILGGSASVEDEIFLASKSGNFIEIRNDFTGSAEVFYQSYSLSSNDGTGNLAAKAVDASGAVTDPSEAVASRISVTNPAWDGSSYLRDENGNLVPRYSLTVDTANQQYALGEYTVAAETYTVTVDAAIENGTVTAQPTEAEEGAEITLTVTPAEGYELATLTVTDASGADVTVENNKFTMPASDVTVSATFTKVETAPALPDGSNVTTNFVTMICDSDPAHEAVTTKWQSGTIVYPTTSTPEWDEELGAWTIGVRIDMIGTKYVWPYFEEKYNDINHDLVASDLVNTEYSRIDTQLKWDKTTQKWVTMDGKPIEIHLTCQTMPEAPSMGYHLNEFQIKVVGVINGEEKAFTSVLDRNSIQNVVVKGNRAEGFTAEVTVALAEDDSYFDAWIAKYTPANVYVYDWSKTEQTVTFTMKYTGDTTGTIYDGPEYWDAAGTTVYTAYVTMEPPVAPDKYGSNVTPALVRVICDTDEDHAPMDIKWQHQSTAVRHNAVPTWNEELDAWTIDIRIDSVSVYYVWLNFEKQYNEILHECVINAPLPEDVDHIDTYLVWDTEQELWVTANGSPIEVHVACQTAPEAPIYVFLKSFSIQVKGDLDHDGIYGESGTTNDSGIYELYSTAIPGNGYTLSEVYGSREEGFFIDVTVTLEDGDIFLKNWSEKRSNGKTYVYDWDLTEKTITFTLKYTGDLIGELNGTRSGDWVLSTTGEIFGTVGEAFVKEDIPAPYYDTVTDELLTVICDTDGERHQPVTGKWYKQHSHTYTDTMAWNAELNTWTIDIRIDSLSIMYVSQLEKANGNTQHTIVGEDTRSIRTTLKWDYEQSLWVPTEAIEIHTECRTAPVAPVYDPQLDGFQIKVYGDPDHDGDYTENNGVYTTHIPEDAMTIGEVYGSREEGFFVDVTIAVKDGDAFITNWIAQKDPGMGYVYDWDKTPETLTITLKYTGDLNGTLHGDRNASNTNVDWVWDSNGKNYGVVAEAYLIATGPAAPVQSNVTSELVAVICDSDGERHETVYGKWYPQHCKTTSENVWNEELQAWTIDVRIGALYIMYVDKIEDANGGTVHELVEDITTVFTTLKWDNAKDLWVPVEPIELHTTCKTAPDAPCYDQMSSYQIKVWGNVDGEEKSWTTSIPENGYVMSEVYGSREEGFFVDVTVTLSENDLYQANWIAQRDPGASYMYDPAKTEMTVTFTLKYNGSLTGTLYGDRHASNTNYDWVLSTTGEIFGVVSEAWVMTAVAQIGDVKYPTVDSAVAAAKPGETVELIADVDVDIVTVLGDITLDLNGHTLAAEYVVAFNGNCVIDSVGTGLLKSEKVKLAADNTYMPAWDEANGGYRFFAMVSQQKFRSQAEDSFVFIAKPLLGSEANDALMAQPETNGLTIKMRLNWTTASGKEVEQFFSLLSEDVKTIYSNSNKIILLNVSGAGAYAGSMYVTTYIESETGVVWAAPARLYTGE